MKQSEVDRLVEDIQQYLSQTADNGDAFPNCCPPPEESAEAGIFIAADSNKRMNRFLKISRYACYSIEALTIGLLTTTVIAPFESWSRTIMFVLGVLLSGLFAVSALYGMQARIKLLLNIESNTQRIALSKARIAASLEKLRLE